MQEYVHVDCDDNHKETIHNFCENNQRTIVLQVESVEVETEPFFPLST